MSEAADKPDNVVQLSTLQTMQEQLRMLDARLQTVLEMSVNYGQLINYQRERIAALEGQLNDSQQLYQEAMHELVQAHAEDGPVLIQ